MTIVVVVVVVCFATSPEINTTSDRKQPFSKLVDETMAISHPDYETMDRYRTVVIPRLPGGDVHMDEDILICTITMKDNSENRNTL